MSRTFTPPLPEHACDQVERAFLVWVEELIEHYGDMRVKEVLGSPAIVSMFTADVGQRLFRADGLSQTP